MMELDFDFDAWQKEQNTKRANRRAELERAFRDGKKVREQMPRKINIWPDCSPFVPEYNTPENLAEHVESREYGFGWALTII